MLYSFFNKIFTEAVERNRANIISLLERNDNAAILDVGCGDGQVTIRYKDKIGCKEVVGVDGVLGRLKAAKGRGVKVIRANLEKRWPFRTKVFDVVISNQVIEHILNIDNFIKETFRILKPGGYCVISTENLASWHNIFSLVLGFQDFSHTILRKKHIGNPMSLHFGEKTATWCAEFCSGVDDSAHPHIKILTYKSLISSFKLFGFAFEKGIGSGYYPLSGALSHLLSKIDPYHSHFITVKMRKPN